MVKRVIAVVVVLAIVGAGGWWAYRTLLPAAAGNGRPVYATAPVERGDIVLSIEGFGPVHPIYESDMQALADGIVQEVYVDRGDTLKAGDLVGLLRNEELMVEISQAQSDMERARLALSEVLDVPPERVTEVDPNRGINIAAPCAGRVTDLQLAAGQETSEGSLVARIVDDSRVIIDAEVPKYAFAILEEGQGLQMTVDDFHGFLPCRITELDPTPIPRGQTFLYRVTIAADNTGLLKPGQGVSLQIPGADGGGYSLRSKISRFWREEVVRSPAAGTVTSLEVKEWTRVGAGDTIAVLGGSTALRFLKENQLDIQDLEVELAQKLQSRENLTIRSPIDGVVAWIRIRPGMKISAGEPVAMVLDQRKMSLDIQVDELDVVYVQEGQEAEITVDALPGQSFPAKVQRVDMMGQTNDGVATYNVNLLVEDTEVLRPGMTGNVSIFIDRKEGVLLVPVEAVFDKDGQAMVEVLDEDGRPQAVPVELGLINSRVAEIVSGLEEGQLVITGSTLDRLDREGEEQPGGPDGPFPVEPEVPGFPGTVGRAPQSSKTAVVP